MSGLFSRMFARARGSAATLQPPAPLSGAPAHIEEILEERVAPSASSLRGETTVTHLWTAPPAAAPLPPGGQQPSAPEPAPSPRHLAPPRASEPARSAEPPLRAIEEQRSATSIERIERIERVEERVVREEARPLPDAREPQRAAVQPPSQPARRAELVRPVAPPAAPRSAPVEPATTEVNIGEIVIRAARPPPPQPRARAQASAPRVSLASYLASRNRR